MSECPITWSSPDGTKCDGFLGTHTCPFGYWEKYTPDNCPENPPYPNGTTDDDYKEALALFNKKGNK